MELDNKLERVNKRLSLVNFRLEPFIIDYIKNNNKIPSEFMREAIKEKVIKETFLGLKDDKKEMVFKMVVNNIN